MGMDVGGGIEAVAPVMSPLSGSIRKWSAGEVYLVLAVSHRAD